MIFGDGIAQRSLQRKQVYYLPRRRTAADMWHDPKRLVPVGGRRGKRAEMKGKEITDASGCGLRKHRCVEQKQKHGKPA